MLSLRDRFLEPINFELAWDKVATNQGCAGVDGETIAEFGRRKARALPALRRAVAAGTYRPMPLRQLFVPKKTGSWRELGVPTVRDCIVQQALLQVLYPVIEAEFEPTSFAYRPGRSHLMAVEQGLTLEQVRGYEGIGATQYFQSFKPLITNPGFDWLGRNFHPPTDPVNSLLSFGYTLLFNNVFSLLLAEGLNPYLGNLHGAERQKAYLAFDLMEEFRSPIVDSLVMRLINQKSIRPTDFSWPKQNQGVYLTGAAKRIFLKRFELRITEKVSHPDVKESVTYRRAIELQVQRYKRALLGNHSYEAFQRVNK
ncbi:CRISPR-associated endonuclease Cas1 [Sphaerothrix gracilis]|uniref:CRISPR-associated endonuclease Cas1 n=1 Tax=Sphaerothrix gracilis TaxID=3151835 RepID=UPI0031FDE089